jgi:hypothetical protein
VWLIQILVLLVFFVGAVIYPAMKGREARTNYPSQQLAVQASTIWHDYQQQPLTIVIADNWLGGNVLLHTKPEPMLLIDNDTVISPWVNRLDVASCGALVLTTVVDKVLPSYAELFKQASTTGTFSLPWGKNSVDYAWAIVSPEANAAPCRFDITRHAD